MESPIDLSLAAHGINVTHIEPGNGSENPSPVPPENNNSSKYIYMRGRRWVFTWNNPPDNWKEKIMGDGTDAPVGDETYPRSDKGLPDVTAEQRACRWYIGKRPFPMEAKFCVAEKECGHATGTTHIQGYFETRQQWYWSTLHKMEPSAYFALAISSQEDNIRYCTKDKSPENEPLFHGEPLRKSIVALEKPRLEDILRDCLTMQWYDFCLKYPVQVFKDGPKYLQYKKEMTPAKPRWDGDLKSKNLWIWGAPRTGKSRWAHSQAEPENTYIKMQNKWWDGYDSKMHKIVIIEDADPKTLQLLTNHMKIWADRYSFDAEIKGASVRIWPGDYRLIVTSNHPPSHIWSDVDLEAIESRFQIWEIQDKNDLRIQLTLNQTAQIQ